MSNRSRCFAAKRSKLCAEANAFDCRVSADGERRPLGNDARETQKFKSPGLEAAAAALSDGGASYGALSDGNAQVELPSSSELVGSVFARVTAAAIRYLIVVEPTPDCQPWRTNQVAALMIDDGVDVAHSSALVKKNVKALLKSHHLVHHALLLPGRTLFLLPEAAMQSSTSCRW
jgi:hypothetical protein